MSGDTGSTKVGACACGGLLSADSNQCVFCGARVGGLAVVGMDNAELETLYALVDVLPVASDAAEPVPSPPAADATMDSVGRAAFAEASRGGGQAVAPVAAVADTSASELSSESLYAWEQPDADPPEEKKLSRAERPLPLIPILVAAMIAAMLGYLVVNSETDSDPDAPLRALPSDEDRAAVVAAYQTWCAGPRTEGIVGAAPFDATETDRLVYSDPGAGTNVVPATETFTDGVGTFASVIVCVDQVGAAADGIPCLNLVGLPAFQPRLAFFHLTAYAAADGEVLAEIDAGPDLTCRYPGADEPTPTEVVVGDPAPDPAVVRDFVAVFVSPRA